MELKEGIPLIGGCVIGGGKRVKQPVTAGEDGGLEKM